MVPRSLLAVLVCALVLASPSVAQTPAVTPGPSLIAELNSICIAGGGDRARVATLAAAAGFSPVPDDVLPRLHNSRDTAGFMRSSQSAISFVMTGVITRRVGRETVVMDFCGVSTRPTDHAALARDLRQTMGFAPVRGAGMDAAYAWLQTPEGRAPTRSLDDAQFLGMARTGQMRLVALDRLGAGSTLLYFLPRIG